MGGREFELLLGGIEDTSIDYQTLREVAKEGPMLMPSVVTESGPFQGRQHVWIGDEPLYGEPQRMAAISYYLAMISSQCLSLTGHDGPMGHFQFFKILHCHHLKRLLKTGSYNLLRSSN